MTKNTNNIQEELFDNGHLNRNLDGVFWSTPTNLLRFRITFAVLTFYFGCLYAAMEWEKFWEHWGDLRYIVLYLIFFYFLACSFLRPRSQLMIPIARAFCFTLMWLQVYIMLTWIEWKCFGATEAEIEGVEMVHILGVVATIILFTAMTVDFFWNRMEFEKMDLLWGWVFMVALASIKFVASKKSGHDIMDPWIFMQIFLALVSDAIVFYGKRAYFRKMTKNEKVDNSSVENGEATYYVNIRA